MPDVLISLGANLGDRKKTIQSAIDSLGAVSEVSITKVSSVYESAPVGGPANQPPFLNAAVLLSTSLSPSQLLVKLHEIEASLGRQRNEHWAARTIDIDILLFDDQVIALRELQVPHRWMPFRSFVLDPAAEIAPAMVHPELRCTIEELKKNFHSQRPYCVIVGHSSQERLRLALEVAKWHDVYLLMRGSTYGELKDSAPELFTERNGEESIRDSRNLMQRPLVFVDDYTQPDFKPEKNWIKFRADKRRVGKSEAAVAPTSLVPKVRLRLCVDDEVWEELPIAPKHHWDYLRAIPVPTLNVAVNQGQFDMQSAMIGLGVCVEPEKFYTKRSDDSFTA